jgi:lysozyme
MDLIDDLKRHEGFRAIPYKDTVGVWTFGHGLTYITEKESDVVVRMRVAAIKATLQDEIKHLNPTRQNVIINMAYNLGINGLRKFRHMWAAIKREDYDTAATEMLNSKWARQVGNRATELSEIMREG